MPIIQELMGQPSVGGQIGKALGGGFGQGISQGITQQLEDFQRKQKSRQALTGLKPLFEQAGLQFTPDEEEEFVNSGVDPAIAGAMAANIYKQKHAQAQQERAEAEKSKKQEGLQNTFNELGEMVVNNLPGIGISPGTSLGINREGVQNRNKFNSMRVRIEGALLPLVNKGALSKERFKFMLDNIPKASDSRRAIVGKLQGLASALSEEGVPLDASFLENIDFGEPKSEKEESFPQAINPKTGQKIIFKGGKWQLHR